MEKWLVALGENLSCEEWGKRPNLQVERGWIGSLIAGMRPEQAASRLFEIGLRTDGVDAVYGQVLEADCRLFVGALRVERCIELLCGRAARQFQELIVGGAAAQCTGAMAGCESGGFIEKEEFGPVPGLHQFSSPAFVFQLANDPGFVSPGGGNQLLIVVVQDSAISGEEAAGWGAFDVGKWRYPVLK